MIFQSWTYNGRDSVPSIPGIYVLYLDNPIKKITEIDKKGVLYIGESSNLRSRLKIVVRPQWKKWYDKNRDEMFNHLLLTYAVDFDDDFNLIISSGLTSKGLLKEGSRLQLKYSISNDHKNIEKKLLKGHFMTFGQLPPFNVRGARLGSIWDSSESQWNKLQSYYKTITNLL
jgi:hypothetical protein